MLTSNAKNQFLKAVCALALLANAHGALASNNPRSKVPEGFAAGTTGGTNGEVVTVTTRQQLAYELCRTRSAGYCSDDTPRTIKLDRTIDFTGTETEPMGKGLGCAPFVNACTAPYKSESLVLLNSNDHHCDGKPLTMIDYDNAGAKPLLVGSNKTLLGVGANAGMKGKGLRLNNVRNVVIRNLTISDINQGTVFAGDAIMIEKAERVWIDHNRFHNIGRQMIAAGFGATTNITISWNKFDGDNTYSPFCNGQHYWNLLLEGSTQTITISNNWFRNISGRAPHVEGSSAKLHMVNNYFQNEEYHAGYGFFHALDARSGGVNVLVEGNYFANIATPITASTGGVFASLGGPTAAMQVQCKSTVMRNCYGNIAKPAPVINHFVQDSVVMKAFMSVDKAFIVLPYTASDVPENVMPNAGPGKI